MIIVAMKGRFKLGLQDLVASSTKKRALLLPSTSWSVFVLFDHI